MKLHTYQTLVKHFIRSECAHVERLLTPLFFGAIVLLLFAFTLPELDPVYRHRIVVTQCLISSFFALQLSLARAFDLESQDRIFDMLKASPLSGSGYILAKLTHVTFVGFCTLLLTVGIATIFQGFAGSELISPSTIGLSLLMILGLSGLGVLLAAITMKSQVKQVLFPILYFPLSTPVLIATSEFLNHHLEKQTWDSTASGWLVMLAAFATIYLALALAMGADAVGSEG